MATIFSNKQCGTAPIVKVSASYTYSRSGANMVYTFTLKFSPVTGLSYLGYPIYADIILDGSKVANGITVKAAIPSQWQNTISKTTSAYTVNNKTSGTVSCTIRIYGADRDRTYSDYSLYVIPYNSKISASNTKAGSTCTISINKSSSSYVHDLKYKFAGADSWASIVAKTAENSYSWTVPASVAYAAMGNNQSVTCQLACTTFSNTSGSNYTQIGSSHTISITVSANANLCAPTVSLTITPDSTTRTLTGASNKVIKYITDVSVSVSASAKNGASISSYRVTCADGKYITTPSGTISNVQSGAFTAIVTDDRGYSNNAEENLTVISYVELTAVCSSVAFNPDTGIASITAKGNFFNGSFGSSTNAITVKYRYKIQGGSYGSWVSIAAGNVVKSGNTYTATATATLDYTKTYVVQIKASDLANTSGVLSAEKTIVSKPTFDWNADNFQFNVPLILNDSLILNNNREVGKLLWSGDWSSGNLTVSGISKYKILLIKLLDQATILFCVNNSGTSGTGTVRGGANFVNADKDILTYSFSASIDNDILTYIGSGYLKHSAGGSHMSWESRAVSWIMGIL